MSGLDVLSICISSTWFHVIGGLANISAIQADACQAANGTGINMGLMPAMAIKLQNFSQRKLIRPADQSRLMQNSFLFYFCN